jgi:uncharacterized protein (DUF983 family)
MARNTRLYSILFNRCPRCHKGNFFVDNNPYHLRTFSVMKDHCDVCGENFARETGFYYGAMYASYGLSVIMGILLFLIMVPLLHLSILAFLITFTILSLLLLPIIYRLSRLIWINLFVGPKK